MHLHDIPLNMQAVVFKIVDVRLFRKINETKKIKEYLEASPHNCENLGLISKTTEGKLEYI